MSNDNEIYRRAMAGFFRFGLSGQPANCRASVINGIGYVELVDSADAALATYRVRENGKLRRIKHIPAGELVNA